MSSRDPERGGLRGAVATALRGSLWPIPVLGIVVALGLGIALPALDRRLQQRDGQPLAFAFSGGPAAAHQVLSAIATSLISVTALVFSLTVVALQLSSSQYTPRLLQTFGADRVVQLTLAQLVLTFVYALTVMRTVRSQDARAGINSFVPSSAITLAYLLTLGSVLALVLFLAHLARALRVETMLRDVHNEATATQRSQGYQENEDGARPTLSLSAARPLVAAASGFLVGMDHNALVRAARESGAVLRLTVRIGDGVVAGTPVAHAWSEGGDLDQEALRRALDRALELRYERQAFRDVPYSLRKIIDIAVRALSPSVNDPTTAVHALSHASALLGDVLQRSRRERCHRDDAGTVRLVVPEWQPLELLNLVVEEPMQFASGQPAVLRRLAGLLREAAWRSPRGVLDDELVRLARRLGEIAADSTDVAPAEIRQWPQQVAAAFAGRWPDPLR